MRKRSKALIGLVVAVAVVAIGVHVFQARIGMVLIARTIDARIGRDLTAGLPDGLHVILCGTGSPIPDPTRAEACTAVIARRHVFVFDIGEGGARKLAGWGMPMGRVERLFLTHFHSDHFDGLGPLMLLRWTAEAAKTPLPVTGPPGVERLVAGFDAAYAIDDGFRVAHHGAAIVPPSGAGATAEPFAMPLPGRPVRVFDRDGVRVVAFAVDHGPVKPAVGYRIDYRGRSIAISGDTAPSASLVSAARRADVLVHEALQPRIVALMTARLEQVGRRNAAQITRDILDYHTTPEQAADAAQAAGVKALLLTHIIPALPSSFLNPAFLGYAGERFSGPITLGRDGTMMSLPAGSEAIETRELD